MKNIYLTLFTLLTGILGYTQNFDYTISMNPISVTNTVGIHSYAFGQYDGKWLIVGGRLDGIHPRPANSSFPASSNNIDLFVIDPINKLSWSAPLSSLPTSIKEQLQSTNMNFHQVGDTLYIIGGYAYSSTAVDHITFPNLTTIIVSSTINAIINSTNFTSYFQQITDQEFAITGGQLGYIDNTFYLVGGHRFDGRYNPMGNPSYTQTYHTGIKNFSISNTPGNLMIDNLTHVTDAVHLRRRDYNLMPQVYPDGTLGYMISSGVFQAVTDMPFLYPVDINSNGYYPQTTFNQYLSHYHSAKTSLYDESNNRMHNIFFGGLSQYYYDNGNLIQNDSVPFVNTISLVTREGDSTLSEFLLPIQMPGLKGASAEFIPNLALERYENTVLKLNDLQGDSSLIGWIYGGIESSSINPFFNNTISDTHADNTIYEVWIKSSSLRVDRINGENPFDLIVSPNIIDQNFDLIINSLGSKSMDYYITTIDGKIIQKSHNIKLSEGEQKTSVTRPPNSSTGIHFLTVVFDGRYFVTKKIIFR
ncbi:MAG: hypothetical protein H6600_01840 [Flavobacteriales bacterium]|nr:hypothetical protein [Flavobacteriales bacterium]